VALVTGSTAGLGRELAFQLCSLGARVALNGRESDKLDRTLQEFRAHGFDTIAVQGDISLPEGCRNIIEQCIIAFGKLDILINNAGLGSGGSFEDTSPETVRKVFEVNTLGTINITRFALPFIRKTKGNIIFISSLAGMVGLPYSYLYSGSKMALTAVCQALRVEMTETGVHVGIVYVGFLKNDIEKRILGPDGKLQPIGERDSFSLQPKDMASRQIIRFIQKRKRKLVLSTMGNLFNIVLMIAPWLVRLVLKNSREKARQMYEPQS